MALMTALQSLPPSSQTIICITPVISQQRRSERWVMASIDDNGHMSPETSGTQWSGHRSRRSEWPDKPLIITPLLSAIVRIVVTRDQWEARLTRIWPMRGRDCGDQVPLQYRARVPGDRGFINSGQQSSGEYCYHDEWPGSQWIMVKLLYHWIIMTQ